MRVHTAFSLLALALMLAPPDPEAEERCTAERLEFAERYYAKRNEGPEPRARLVEEVRQLIERHDGKAPECLGRLEEHRAYLYVLDERYEDAIAEMRAYLDTYGDGASVRTQVTLRLQLGWALVNVGRTIDATRAYAEAARRGAKAPARFSVRAYVTAAMTVRDLGDLAASEEYLTHALDLVRDSIASNPRLEESRGAALVSLSLLREAQIGRATSTTQRDSLVAQLERESAAAVRSLDETGQEGGRRGIALALNALAISMQGDHATAVRQVREAYPLARQAGALVPAAPFVVTIAEGRIHRNAGDLDAAERRFLTARQEGVRIEDSQSEAQALEWLGRITEDRRRWDEAEAHYRAAIPIREEFRDRLGLDDWSVTAFETMMTPYEGLVRVQIEQGDVEGALQTLDLTKARFLRDLRLSHRSRQTLAAAERQRADSLVELRQQARRDLLAARGVSDRLAARQRATALQQQLDRILGDTEGPSPLDVDALRVMLGEHDRTLVAYVIGEAESAAFVVTQDTVAVRRIEGDRIALRSLVARLGGHWRGQALDPAVSLPALHDLYVRLVEPVRDLVTTEAVTIITDDETAGVPFGMLTTARAESYADAPYLLRDWTITTELAPSLLLDPPSDELEVTAVGAFGISQFDVDRFTWNAEEPLPGLPHAEREARRVARAGSGEAYLGAAATKRQFFETASRARVVHVASHAEADPLLPLYSRIALAPDGDGDGTLHLYEVLDSPVRSDLVVLSACETAGGTGRRGEGTMSLQYGMRAAGSRATLATLWPVDDDATVEIMGAFYDGLADGLGKDAALRRAQLRYLDGHEGIEASPFFWAAPVLSGDPRPVPIQTPRPWGILIGLLAVVGLAWGLFSRSRRARA